jgi:hypothetical protein
MVDPENKCVSKRICLTQQLGHTLIKKIEFSVYLRKFGVEQLQSNI